MTVGRGSPTDPARERAPLSLKANFSWILVGNLVYGASQWGMLVVLARLGTPETVGRFVLALAICAPVFTLTNLQLRSIEATDVRREFRFEEYLGVRLLTLVLAFVFILGVTLALGYRELLLVVGVVAGAKLFEFSSDLLYGVAQRQQRMDSVGRSLVLRGTVALFLFALGMLLTGQLLGAVLGLSLGFAGSLLFYDLRWARRLLAERPGSRPVDMGRIRPELRTSTLKRVVLRALPFAVVMTLNSLNTNVPRYVLEHFSGEAALGTYAALTYFLIGGTKVMQALGTSTLPTLAELYTAGRIRRFAGLAGKLLVVASALGLVGIVAAITIGRTLLDLVYGAEYAVYRDAFVWVMVAAAIGYVGNVLGYAITATRRFRKFVVPNTLPTVVALASSFLLIPNLGLGGAVGVLIAVSAATCLPPIVIWRSIHGRFVVADLVKQTPGSGATSSPSAEKGGQS